MDEVLELIADSVSTLVIALTDSEEKNTLFGDMVPATELIKQAVDGMIEAANITRNEVDPEFQMQIDDNSSQLSRATQDLVDAAHKVRADPWDRVPQKDAIRAAKNILQKVVLLVLIEEMANIKVLVKIAKLLGDGTKRIDDTNSAPEAEAAMEEVEALEAELVRRCARRADGCKNGELRQNLINASDKLRFSVQQHHQAARAWCRTKSDSDNRGRHDWSRKTLAATDDVIEAVKQIFAEASKFVDAAFKWQPIRTMAEDAAAAAAREVARHLATLVKHVHAGDGLDKARALIQAAQRQVDAAQAVADKTDDPIKRDLILAGIQHLKSELPQLINAVKEAIAHPGDARVWANLDEKVRNTTAASEGLAAAVSMAPNVAVAALGNRLASELDALQDAIKRGDKALANQILNGIGNLFDRHIEAAEIMINGVSDPVTREQVKRGIDGLRAIKEPILTTARHCIDNPSDQEAQRKLGGLIDQAKRHISDISYPHEQVSAWNHQLHHDLDNLQDCVNRGGEFMADEALIHAKRIAEDVAKQIEAAQQVMNALKDPARKREIKEAIDRLKNVADRLQNSIRDVIANPKDPAARKRMNDLVAETRAASDNLTSVCQPRDANELRQIQAAHARAGKAGQPQQSDFKIEQKAGAYNPSILGFAQDIEKASKKKELDPNSPLGRLTAFSQQIAAEMAALSAALASGDVKAMIVAARKIAELTKQINTSAKQVAAECNDPRLKANVLNFSTAAQNYSTQLKIIATVTESSAGVIADQQLVVACKGLSGFVVQCLDAAQSASVKK
eukprot:TRINITY_DN2329_c0_g1_i2.p1 TRINITY_DN2329_c0_g1~~TRINITY_DN2329_c0_g1_i2.p1  ORF type:complete len:794 (-),score=283.21 TRINITY_DN2329_c0_g1_i2:96-2477(-)